MNRRSFITKALAGLAAVPLIGKLPETLAAQRPAFCSAFARGGAHNLTACPTCGDTIFRMMIAEMNTARRVSAASS